MDRNAVFSQFVEVFSDVLDIDDPAVTDATTANDFEEWDSLSNIRLIVALERNFGVKFSNSEIEGLGCVGDLIDKLVEKV